MKTTNKKILIIEDEEDISIILSYLLEAEGFQTIQAPDGATGIQWAGQHLPDLILSDITMPGMNGYQVIEQLQKNPVTCNIPFVFLTARAEKTSLQHGMELGAGDYITKPFERKVLLEVVEYHLQNHQAISEAFMQPVSQNTASGSVGHFFAKLEERQPVAEACG
jgi:DNA-binding response OmpR family regulator